LTDSLPTNARFKISFYHTIVCPVFAIATQWLTKMWPPKPRRVTPRKQSRRAYSRETQSPKKDQAWEYEHWHVARHDQSAYMVFRITV
jgi:hypothetical protein